VDVVIDDDPVGVVGDLGLVAELDRLTEPALDDRTRVRIVQRHQPAGPWRGLAGQAGAGLGDDLAGALYERLEVVD
jgi:hypothetical protein